MALIDTRYALTFEQLLNDYKWRFIEDKLTGEIGVENQQTEVYSPDGLTRIYVPTGYVKVRIKYKRFFTDRYTFDHWHKDIGEQNYKFDHSVLEL